MKDIISFDVKLTPNQKKAQDKLNQVHRLYDEIEKLLGTQDVFKRPHLFMELPQKEPKTNEEYIKSLNTEQLAEEMLQQWIHGAYHGVGEFGLTDKEIELSREDIVEWLKQPYGVKK